MSHLEPQEPKGVHPQVEEERVKMENNYEIEAEMIKNLEKKMEKLEELLKVCLENEEKVEIADIRSCY